MLSLKILVYYKMKFLIYGDEERFLLDRIKELNRNFNKETRVRLLRVEVKKRERILRRRWKRYRSMFNYNLIINSSRKIVSSIEKL